MTDPRSTSPHIDDLASLRAGGKRALAEALARVEQGPDEVSIAALIDQAFLAPRAHVIGFTGPPGVGKSTLINTVVRRWRMSGVTVGVIAIDPSSHLTRGALLGDRVRMRTDPDDHGVFVRSLAARGQLGGLAELAFPTVVLMRALFDRVIVETVGIGQSEADISKVADLVVLCVQPGSGDSLQFMKAGIMEIPDLAVVTKADMGPPARRTLADLKGALGLANGAYVTCLMLSASNTEEVDGLIDSLEQRLAAMSDLECAARRRAQSEGWLRSSILQRFGSQGLAAAEKAHVPEPDAPPFEHFRAIASRLRVTYEA